MLIKAFVTEWTFLIDATIFEIFANLLRRIRTIVSDEFLFVVRIFNPIDARNDVIRMRSTFGT